MDLITVITSWLFRSIAALQCGPSYTAKNFKSTQYSSLQAIPLQNQIRAEYVLLNCIIHAYNVAFRDSLLFLFLALPCSFGQSRQQLSSVKRRCTTSAG